MNEQELENEVKHRYLKKLEAEKINHYYATLKETTKETFVDKPDEVKEIFILNSTRTSLEIEWDEPEANKSIISGYTIYLNDAVRAENVVENFYIIEDLIPETVYKIYIVAQSDKGDGYKTNKPTYA